MPKTVCIFCYILWVAVVEYRLRCAYAIVQHPSVGDRVQVTKSGKSRSIHRKEASNRHIIIRVFINENKREKMSGFGRLF